MLLHHTVPVYSDVQGQQYVYITLPCLGRSNGLGHTLQFPASYFLYENVKEGGKLASTDTETGFNESW